MFYVIWSVVIAFCVVADQISKFFVVQNIALESGRVTVIPGVLEFMYTQNPGAAFGSMQDENSRWIFMSLSTVAILGILIYLFWKRPKSKLLCASLALIVGGGIGNMIDRFALKYVVDFLEFTFIDFPVFNIADVCIVVGTFMMAAYILFFDKTLFVDNKKTSETVKEEKDTQTDVGTHNENL